MLNGPMVGGFLIALTLVVGAFFAGTWFRSAFAFAETHTLDAARETRPVICSFATDELGGKTTGTIRVRDGLMRFDLTDERDGAMSEWGIEIDMNSTTRMMSRAAPTEPYVSLGDYPDLRVQIIEDLRKIMRSDKLHCSPWWSANSFRFELQPRL